MGGVPGKRTGARGRGEVTFDGMKPKAMRGSIASSIISLVVKVCVSASGIDTEKKIRKCTFPSLKLVIEFVKASAALPSLPF